MPNAKEPTAKLAARKVEGSVAMGRPLGRGHTMLNIKFAGVFIVTVKNIDQLNAQNMLQCMPERKSMQQNIFALINCRETNHRAAVCKSRSCTCG